MNIIYLNKAEKEEKARIALALGNFDGVHRGHKYLINRMISSAKENNLEPSVLLFDKHSKLVTKDSKVELLSSLDEKIKLLEKLGVKNVFLINFDEDLMRLSGEQFFKQILVDKINVEHITVGFDYSFGYKASSNSDDLEDLAKKSKIGVDIIEAIYVEDYLISSTLIRQFIKDGKISEANKLLGHNFKIEGKVVSGDGRGRKLGFPTANLESDINYVKPKNGVYATRTRIGKNIYKSISNIGMTPTFDNDKLKLETYILDFNEQIYGDTIEVEFMKYIREERSFNSVEDLKKQIKIDIESIDL